MTKTIDILDLTDFVKGRMIGHQPDGSDIQGTCAIDNYAPHKVSFLKNKKYISSLEKLRNAVVLITEDLAYVTETYPQNTYILVNDAAHAILNLQEFFYSDELKIKNVGISPTARIDASSSLGKDVFVEDNVHIGKNVIIGDRSKIATNTVILDNVVIGDDTVIESGAVIRRDSRIGNNVIIHSGVCIGSDLFRYEQNMAPLTVHKMLQTGFVDIGNRVEIGWNSVICKATFENCATVLSDDVKIADLVCIGHNVRIGARTLIAAQACVSGSTKIGEDVWVGVGASISNGLTIGNRVKILINAVVVRDIPDDERVSGFYAMPHRLWKRACDALKEFAKID
jgi:UDP-3-O-[3-hydroxymyristoyl] glucosamine N-acyltransferase